MEEERYVCPCCGYKTLSEEPPGTYEICKICFWEDDEVQFDDPDYEGGANCASLREAQTNFLEYGACEKRVIPYVRKPTKEDVYIGTKDISNIKRMPIEELVAIFRVLNLPIEKIIDLYIGNISIKKSNFVFNSDQLSKYLSEKDLEDYYIVKIDSNSTQDEIDDKLNFLKERFINSVNELYKII